ncbi:unknown [Helicoverpa armigera nucleopolyhedrovirus]|uniref:Pif-7 n=2 Tax=Helicoverpa armigera nucleopolyhedrovirus TaxID=51313 RepID=Q99GV6_9ABAC|nr:hypothetical protein HanGV4gp093 [Helicoverpa armigera nucleopolyhedrovirus G4]NP_203648.1 hypothetical protein [Helicoverpa armigera nucleopolyhedrovirus]AAG53836.1 unknown [Helicoverpa armigera nucleopolyhedrovirus G4]AAK96386.1 unknown [Helicoverpa armigera nucleopolyhedrovirus]AEN04016.1 hypothetical protein [Helicoverpa armigera NPV strain Australia]
MMLVIAVFILLSFIFALGALYLLRQNKRDLRRQLYYQYKYIPEPLVSLVTVHKLKTLQ